MLDSLSSKDVTFFIPPYQRNYEWSTDTCRVFLDDVTRVAQRNMAGGHTEHFFGSIVYVVHESGFGVPDVYTLTDGQQRITTTMLFLMALRDSLDDAPYQDTIQRRFLENDQASGDNAARDKDYKIKLKQVESDWEAYKLLALRMEVPESLKNSAVFLNYSFFRRAIAQMPESEKKSLLEHGLSKFSIIAVQLEPERNPWENPQEIFESMNSLGKPLSLADLVRNFLLMKRSSREQTRLYNDYWLILEKRLPGRLSEFVRDWMQADRNRSFKVATSSNFKELYGSFKEIAGDRTVEELLESFVSFSRPYLLARGEEVTGAPNIDQIVADLNIIGVEPKYSYLAQIFSLWVKGDLSDDALTQVLAAIRTYLLRRRVLGIASGENKTFPAMGKQLDVLVSSEDVTQEIFRQLSSYEYALRLPNDDEVRWRLASVNFYNLGRQKSYPKLLLSMLEETLTRARPNWEDERLQLEHIMPQSLSDAWRSELGENWESDHQEYLNNIGNLTLIRHNQELGKKPFLEKKEVYRGKSGLQVTQNYVLEVERWNAKAIQERRDYLLDLLIDEVIQVPQKFKKASNWGRGPSDAESFDSKPLLSQLIGQTITFRPNPNLEAVVISDSLVRFDGEEWRLGPLTKELKAREGTVGKSSVFHGPTYWSWDGVRLIDLDL